MQNCGVSGSKEIRCIMSDTVMMSHYILAIFFKRVDARQSYHMQKRGDCEMLNVPICLTLVVTSLCMLKHCIGILNTYN